MMEDHRADAGLRLHHHAFGQLHADFLGLQQLPDALLIVQVRDTPDSRSCSACRDSAT